MSSSTAASVRLERLLAFLERDTGNLLLRETAIREACDAGCWETAGSLIEAGLQAHPAQARLLAFSGLVHLNAHRYRDAEEALSAAVAQGLNTREMPALLLRARCHHFLGKLEEAIADCERHLTGIADDGDAHGLLALVLYEQHRKDEANEHAREALIRKPQQLEALLALACLLADSGQSESARAAFDLLLKAHPRCARGWFALALLELSQKQLEAAKRAIERAALDMPDHIGTWHVLAWIEIMLGNVPAAHSAFRRALALDRNFSETHGGLAVIGALEGRDEEARLYIKRALRLDRQSVAVCYAELLLLQREGKTAQAKAVLDEVLARPASAAGLQYRELVAAHFKTAIPH